MYVPKHLQADHAAWVARVMSERAALANASLTIDQASDAVEVARVALVNAKTTLAEALGVWTEMFLAEGEGLGYARPLTDAEEVRSRAYGEREALVRHEDAVRASLVRANRGTGFDRGGW